MGSGLHPLQQTVNAAELGRRGGGQRRPQPFLQRGARTGWTLDELGSPDFGGMAWGQVDIGRRPCESRFGEGRGEESTSCVGTGRSEAGTALTTGLGAARSPRYTGPTCWSDQRLGASGAALGALVGALGAALGASRVRSSAKRRGAGGFAPGAQEGVVVRRRAVARADAMSVSGPRNVQGETPGGVNPDPLGWRTG